MYFSVMDFFFTHLFGKRISCISCMHLIQWNDQLPSVILFTRDSYESDKIYY